MFKGSGRKEKGEGGRRREEGGGERGIARLNGYSIYLSSDIN